MSTTAQLVSTQRLCGGLVTVADCEAMASTPETVGSGRFPSLNRREFLHGASAVALTFSLLPILPGFASAQISPPLLQLGARPREDWAQGLAPVGELQQEQPGEVKFLLVHHTVSGNGYAPEDVSGLIRGFYAAHTGPEKGWPDVAYNFFVDRFGTIWEGRAGSLAGPVKPDATGGSQGFAQLGCFIGDHQTEAPSEPARLAMIALLAALADTYVIETAPGSMTSFVSRGSNRWPPGAPVAATTIAGHRDMSQTVCPGDAAYDLVQNVFPAEVTALRASRATPPATTSTPPDTAAPGASPKPSGAAGTSEPAANSAAAGPEQDEGIWGPELAAVTGGLLAAGTGGVIARTLMNRRAARFAEENGPPPG